MSWEECCVLLESVPVSLKELCCTEWIEFSIFKKNYTNIVCFWFFFTWSMIIYYRTYSCHWVTSIDSEGLEGEDDWHRLCNALYHITVFDMCKFMSEYEDEFFLIFYLFKESRCYDDIASKCCECIFFIGWLYIDSIPTECIIQIWRLDCCEIERLHIFLDHHSSKVSLLRFEINMSENCIWEDIASSYSEYKCSDDYYGHSHKPSYIWMWWIDIVLIWGLYWELYFLHVCRLIFSIAKARFLPRIPLIVFYSFFLCNYRRSLQIDGVTSSWRVGHFYSWFRFSWFLQAYLSSHHFCQSHDSY